MRATGDCFKLICNFDNLTIKNKCGMTRPRCLVFGIHCGHATSAVIFPF